MLKTSNAIETHVSAPTLNYILDYMEILIWYLLEQDVDT